MGMAEAVAASRSVSLPGTVRAYALLYGEVHSRVVVAVKVPNKGEATEVNGPPTGLNVPFVRLGL